MVTMLKNYWPDYWVQMLLTLRWWMHAKYRSGLRRRWLYFFLAG